LGFRKNMGIILIVLGVKQIILSKSISKIQAVESLQTSRKEIFGFSTPKSYFDLAQYIA